MTTGLRTVCAACFEATRRLNEGEGTRLAISAVVGLVAFFIAIRMGAAGYGGDAFSWFFLFCLIGGPGFLTYLILLVTHQSSLVPQQAQSCKPSGTDFEYTNQRVAPFVFKQVTAPEYSLLASDEAGLAVSNAVDDAMAAGLAVLIIFEDYIPSSNSFEHLEKHLATNFPPLPGQSFADYKQQIRSCIARKFCDRVESVVGAKAVFQDYPTLVRVFPPKENENADLYASRLDTTCSYELRLGE